MYEVEDLHLATTDTGINNPADTIEKTQDTDQLLKRNAVPAQEDDGTVKAEKFSHYLHQHSITFFSQTTSNGVDKSSKFHSNMLINGHKIPFFILLDRSIYVIIRVHVATNCINYDNLTEMLSYINSTNAQYKIFKYMTAANGDLMMDTYMTFLAESFEPNLVLQMVETIVNHLKEEYPVWQDRINGGK